MSARTRTHLLLMLDYDGTLVPIRARPRLARLSAARRLALARLARLPGIVVAIVTGRSLADIRKLAGVPGAVLAANHGFEVHWGGRTSFPCGRAVCRPMGCLAEDLEAALGVVPGILVESKGFSVAVHYRLTPHRRWREVEEIVRRLSLPYRRRFKWRVTGGKRVWEVRPARRWNKGDVVRWISERFAPGAIPLYIGDDETDEDAFRALRGRGVTVAVGRRRRTAATHGVKDVAGVWRLLRALTNHNAQRRVRGRR